ncbi:MAG: amidohydrolase [Caldilineaceae bacterium]
MIVRDLSPDTIVFNGVIHTLDPQSTVTQALAIKDGRIIALGADAEILPLAGTQTQRIDLRGGCTIPGIFDSHAHLLEVGLKLTHVRLDECRSPEEMMELVRKRAEITPPGHWIIGQGWNEGNFDLSTPPGRLPTRWDIDPATDQHPVILQRFFNMDVVNSVALRMAGITRHTPDPTSGKIEHDADGEPNGIIRAAAKLLVRSLLPRPTWSQLHEAIKLGCQDFNRYGITSVLDPGLYPYEIQAYQRYYQAGSRLQVASSESNPQLSVRLNLLANWHGFREDETEAELDARAQGIGIFSGLGDEWLKIGGLKMAIDGGTSSRTAWMYEPFEGESEVRGFNRLSPERLYRYFRTAQELGWDVGIHTCGDRAMDVAVETFARVMQDVPQADMRHNIIHAYFPSDKAIQLMAKHRIAAVVQPTFVYWEGDMIFRDVGERRAANYKPVRKLLDHGVIVTASSDVPSTPSHNPFPALYALVTRKNNLDHFVAQDQAVSRLEALRLYTHAGTWLTREESLKGTLEIGKVADLALLDRDYFGVSDEEIKETKVTMTMVNGQLVWQNH